MKLTLSVQKVLFRSVSKIW